MGYGIHTSNAAQELGFNSQDNMTKLSYNVSTGLYDVTDLKPMIVNGMREDFLAHGWDFFIRREDVVTKIPEKDLLKLIRECLESARGDEDLAISQAHFGPNIIEFGLFDPSRNSEDVNIISTADHVKVFVDLSRGSDMDNDDASNSIDETILVCAIETIGIEKMCREFLSLLKEELTKRARKKKTSLVKWMFNDANGEAQRNFQIQKEWDIDESYYPAINGNLKDYYKAFMASKAQILVLYGKPGNGKTSFIRDMICETGINAFISYDLKILTSDSTFVQYITNKLFDAIIIEDADELLTSTRGEHNKVIAKILKERDAKLKEAGDLHRFLRDLDHFQAWLTKTPRRMLPLKTSLLLWRKLRSF